VVFVMEVHCFFCGVLIKCTLFRRNSCFKWLKQMHPLLLLLLLLLLWLYSRCGPWPFIQLPNLYTVGRTLWTSDQPVARPLPTHRTTQTQNKRTQTSMPWVVFEPMIPAFERAKTVNVFYRAATVIGKYTPVNNNYNNNYYYLFIVC
jgi:hypothetical protein